jgi:uncharacterized protein (DUF305 family)
MRHGQARALRALASVVLALVLAACSIEINTSDDPGGASADGHNDADVSFASEMIPHHTQALAMIAMTRGRDLDGDFEALVEDMADTQRAEIDLMAGWLREWGEDVPEGWGMGSGPGGMMDRDEMRDLMGPGAGPMWRDGTASRFEEMWLRMMIRHHEGAIEISAVERSAGEYEPALDLAEDIIDAQSAEIETMEQMLR